MMLPAYIILSLLSLGTGGELERTTAWVSGTGDGEEALASHTATGRRARVGIGRMISLSSDELLDTCVNFLRVVVVVRPRAIEISLSWRR